MVSDKIKQIMKMKKITSVQLANHFTPAGKPRDKQSHFNNTHPIFKKRTVFVLKTIFS